MRQKKLAEIESRAAAGLGPVEPSPEQVNDAQQAVYEAILCGPSFLAP